MRVAVANGGTQIIKSFVQTLSGLTHYGEISDRRTVLAFYTMRILRGQEKLCSPQHVYDRGTETRGQCSVG